MAFALSTCPIDRGQIEWFGMARYRKPQLRKPVFVRWYQCQSCNTMHAMTDRRIVFSRKPFNKDELKSLFPRGKDA